MVHHPYGQTHEQNTMKAINTICHHPSVLDSCCAGAEANMDQINLKRS